MPLLHWLLLALRSGGAHSLLLSASPCVRPQFLNQQFFANIRAGNAARVALITAIYEKSLRLSRASRQLQSTGSTVNLQALDSSRIFDCALFLHFIYMAPLIIAVALALMIVQVGVAAIAGVALLCLLSPLQAYTSRLTARNRRAMLKFSDQRVKLMNEILQGENHAHSERTQRSAPVARNAAHSDPHETTRAWKLFSKHSSLHEKHAHFCFGGACVASEPALPLQGSAS